MLNSTTGLCKQSGKFKDECLHLAEQYYPIMYEFLTKGLNPTEVCGLMGLCNTTSQPTITLLLPEDLKPKVKNQLIGNDERNSYTTSQVSWFYYIVWSSKYISDFLSSKASL